MKRLTETALVLGLALSMALLLWQAVSPRPEPASAEGAVDWPAVELNRLNLALAGSVQVTHAGDGSGRLFVVERTGRIWIIRDGQKVEPAFLDVSDRIDTGNWEQGLLGLAFPPAFESLHYFYIYYTDLAGDTVVARYRVSDDDPDRADPASEMVILTVDQPFDNHNGGQLAYGPEGYLYVGLGDGGSGGDPFDNAQNPAQLLGKILRIDVDPVKEVITSTLPAGHSLFLPAISQASYFSYAVPASNPFTQTAGYRGEIWALGLRNPWRFSFDRDTGDLYIGDVGQNTYEEIDFQPAASLGGENYGWRIMEGTHCYNPATCSSDGLVLPVVEYDHSAGNCSVSGGAVYRGAEHPALAGSYFYADFCSGRVWGLRKEAGTWQNSLLDGGSAGRISSFGEDEAGNLFVTIFSTHGGDIAQIVPANPR